MYSRTFSGTLEIPIPQIAPVSVPLLLELGLIRVSSVWISLGVRVEVPWFRA